MLASPDITHASAISNPLIYAGPSLPVDQWDGNNGGRSIRMHFHSVDYDIIETLGLASFIIQQRQEEIGVRKVMGSRVGQLVMLLTKDFTRWVLLAGVIGLPVGYYAMSRWLQGFHYRTDISLTSFFIALLIAVLTVSIQTYRASVRNPVDTLRDE